LEIGPDTQHGTRRLLDKSAYKGIDKPVIFAFHGYPAIIHELTYRRHNHDNIHVRSYKEEGTTTTPFDMVVLNNLDRYQLALDAIRRIPRLSDQVEPATARYWTTMERHKLPRSKSAFCRRRGKCGSNDDALANGRDPFKQLGPQLRKTAMQLRKEPTDDCDVGEQAMTTSGESSASLATTEFNQLPPASKSPTRKRQKAAPPSEWALVFDCETKVDASQNLRFGAYQVRKAAELMDCLTILTAVLTWFALPFSLRSS
jgi:hypothetical protein